MFVMSPAPAVLRAHRHTTRSLDSAASLARVFDHLFDDVPRHAAPTPVRTPALDVAETDSHYLLSFELPGVAKAALKVSIDGRRVQIETVATSPDAPADLAGTEAAAQGTAPAEPATPRMIYRERAGARFARTVSLPQEVDSDASEARFDEGVLTLRLAKRRPDGARQLKVS